MRLAFSLHKDPLSDRTTQSDFTIIDRNQQGSANGCQAKDAHTVADVQTILSQFRPQRTVHSFKASLTTHWNFKKRSHVLVITGEFMRAK
jgi:hypothetical protein